MRKLITLSSLMLALAACGGSDSSFTVSGKTLNVVETNFGSADYFCPTLTNGQFMVVMSDAALCAQVHAGKNTRQIFHSGDETNLRLVFRSGSWSKIPATTTFHVGSGTKSCMSTSSDAEAVAYFSHASAGQAEYDLDASAASGSITVTYPTGYPTPSNIKGTFDLMFGSDHVVGSFDANFCMGMPGIGPGFGS